MSGIDKTIHEPARLRILTLLASVDVMDFSFLLMTLGLTKGNLSSHMDRLEKVGYIAVEKTFNGKVPHTQYKLTSDGRGALETYWRELDSIRQMVMPEVDASPVNNQADASDATS
ncbi:MAG: transcriptional regulator [Candidatus Hydrogenedentes bacterium]|nr:transcriptional regulator [Candidatus Hydrogenedentota bacterium]